MNYLLDTCTFLWMVQQPSLLPKTVAAILNQQSNDLYISDVSVWEVTLKHSAGKLPLPDSPRIWIAEKLVYHQFKTLALNREAIYRSGELDRVHSDPFDRLLAAQAIEAGMTILSPDLPLSLLGASRMW